MTVTWSSTVAWPKHDGRGYWKNTGGVRAGAAEDVSRHTRTVVGELKTLSVQDVAVFFKKSR
jgi:hypothetical protein